MIDIQEPIGQDELRLVADHFVGLRCGQPAILGGKGDVARDAVRQRLLGGVAQDHRAAVDKQGEPLVMRHLRPNRAGIADCHLDVNPVAEGETSKEDDKRDLELARLFLWGDGCGWIGFCAHGILMFALALLSLLRLKDDPCAADPRICSSI